MATHSSSLAWRIPGDGGAWWAALYGVAQSQTGLKRLSSSSSNTYMGPRFLKVKSFFNYQRRAKVATFAMCIQTLWAHVLEAGWIQVLGDLSHLQFLLYLLLMSPMRHVSLALHIFASTYIDMFRELVMDREAWRAAIHGVTKSRTRLSDWTKLNWTDIYMFTRRFIWSPQKAGTVTYSSSNSQCLVCKNKWYHFPGMNLDASLLLSLLRT